MERYQKIYNHFLYAKMLKNINEAEKDRIFCLHGFDHAVDTARIAYILCLEEDLDIDKDLIYAIALLHDIGRYNINGKEHHEAGAEIAEIIMHDCGFSDTEIITASNAIRTHRQGGKSKLEDLLYRADKLSRKCFCCNARSECYWSYEKRNHLLKY